MEKVWALLGRLLKFDSCCWKGRLEWLQVPTAEEVPTVEEVVVSDGAEAEQDAYEHEPQKCKKFWTWILRPLSPLGIRFGTLEFCWTLRQRLFVSCFVCCVFRGRGAVLKTTMTN